DLSFYCRDIARRNHLAGAEDKFPGVLDATFWRWTLSFGFPRWEWLITPSLRQTRTLLFEDLAGHPQIRPFSILHSIDLFTGPIDELLGMPISGSARQPIQMELQPSRSCECDACPSLTLVSNSR